MMTSTSETRTNPSGYYYFEIANGHPVSIICSLNLTNCFYKEKVLEVASGKRTVVL
jgi:hypothetical protein